MSAHITCQANTTREMFDLSRMEEAMDEAEREARQMYYSEYLKFDMGLKGIFPPSLENPPKVVEANPIDHQMACHHFSL